MPSLKPLHVINCKGIYARNLQWIDPPHDVILCMKDYLTKEEILSALRNTNHIELDGVKIQIYPNISQATLDRRHKMKEVTSALQAAHIKYHWGFPFKLTLLHSGTTYTVYSTTEGKEPLVKLGLMESDSIPRQASTPRPNHLWATPSPRWDRRRWRQPFRDLPA